MKRYIVTTGCIIFCISLWVVQKENGMFRSIAPSLDDEEMKEIRSEPGSPLKTYPLPEDIIEDEALGIDEDMPEMQDSYAIAESPYIYREDLYSPVVTSPETSDASPAPSKDITPLMYAAATGDKETARKLIRSNVNINAQDKNGRTALMYAIAAWGLQGADEIVKMLIDAGADWSVTDKEGHTVYFYVQDNPLISSDIKKQFSEIFIK